MAEFVARKLAIICGMPDYNPLVERLMPVRKTEGLHLLQLYDKFSSWTPDVLRSQPERFLEVILNFRPVDYQIPFIRAFPTVSRSANRWSRQSGKTKTSSGLVIMDCLTIPNARWMVSGPSKRVSDVVMLKMQEHYYSMNPLLARALIVEALKTSWTFCNNATLFSTPNAMHALRGDTLNGSLLEEYDFIKNADIVLESVVKPMLARVNGRLIVNSTPWDVSGEFRKLFCTEECHPERGEHRAGASCGQWAQTHVTWEQAVRAGIIHTDFAAQNIIPLKDTDFAKYRREWLAEWSEEVNTYFPVQLLRQSTDEMLVYRDLDEPHWSGDWLFGIDLGEEVDYSFLVGLRKRRAPVDGKSSWEVAFRKMWPLHTSLIEIRGYCAACYDRAEHVGGFFVDATNNTYFAQDLQSDVGIAEGVRFTQSGDNWPMSIGKESFFSYLKTGLRNHRLKLAYDSELYEHLNIVKFEMAKNGHYHFSHPAGTHDDGAFALGLAWYGTHDSSAESSGLTTTDRTF
jgi:hypothetical protein